MVERMSDMSDEAFEEPLVKSQAPEGGLGIKDPDSAFTLLASNSTPNSTPNTTPETPTPSLFKRFQTPIRALLAGVTLFGAQTISSGALPGNAKEGVKNPQGQSREIATNPETKIYSDYKTIDLKSTGSELVTVVESNGKRFVGINSKDSGGNDVIKSVGTPPFFVLAAARLSDTIVAVGDKERGANQGKIWLTKDGGKKWSLIETNSGTMWAVQITPDAKYAYISSATSENGVLLVRLDLTSGTVTNFSVPGTPIDMPAYVVSPLAIDGNTYTGYTTVPLYTGYYQMVYGPDNIQATRFNIDEGYARGELVNFLNNQSQQEVWLINNDVGGYPPNNSHRRTGTIYRNVNNIMQNIIQPNIALHPEAGPNNSLTIFATIADTETDKGYMAVSVDGNLTRSSNIEIFALSDPTNLTKRETIPQDGDWPTRTSDKDLIEVKSLKQINLLGKKLLVVGITKSAYVYDAPTITWNIVFINGGLMVRDITSGISSSLPWKKFNLIQEIIKYYLNLPNVNKQFEH